MIAPLMQAEIIKATRQRGTFFAAYLIVPCFVTLLTTVLGGAVLQDGQARAAAIPLLHSMTRALGVGGNPIANSSSRWARPAPSPSTTVTRDGGTSCHAPAGHR